MPETTGIFLGKFAPLHDGHRHVIDTALDEVDDLIVMPYTAPDTTDIPLTTRADWIRDLYPNVGVLPAWNGPTETGYTDELKQKHERYVEERLDGRDVTHFYSSEPYGAHMSEALDAVDRRIDPDRDTVPISATQIRADPYRNRDFVPDRVYRDLVTNVVFLGAPATGKSTITERMAERHDTAWMPEYGRTYWEEHEQDGILTQDQLVELAEGHLEREDEKLLEADTYLFTDTNAITTYIFSHDYHDDAPDRLRALAEDAATRYDLVFLCDTDIPYDHTPDRRGKQVQERMQRHTRSFLDHHQIPYHVLTGDVEERAEQVDAVLETFDPHDAEQT